MLDIALQQIQYRAQKLGLSAALTAKLAGISAGTYSNAMSGIGKLKPSVEADLGDKLRRLEKFHDALTPFQLPRDILLLNELAVSDLTVDECVEFVKRAYPYHHQ